MISVIPSNMQINIYAPNHITPPLNINKQKHINAITNMVTINISGFCNKTIFQEFDYKKIFYIWQPTVILNWKINVFKIREIYVYIFNGNRMEGLIKGTY